MVQKWLDKGKSVPVLK